MSYVNRAIAIAEAELGRVTTAGERQRLLEAWALQSPAGSTNEQIAKVHVTRHLQMDLDQINFKEGGDASSQTITANKATWSDAGT
jgi:hypothetical protein